MMGNKLALTLELMGQDCTNGGVSSGKATALVIGETIDGYLNPDSDHHRDVPVLVLVKGNTAGLVKLVPAAAWHPETKGKWVMFGGRFGTTSDSRFYRAIEALTGAPFDGAVKIHDRIEE